MRAERVGAIETVGATHKLHWKKQDQVKNVFWEAISQHSELMSNQTKVWKTKTGPLQGDKAWYGDPKSELSEILHEEHFK